MNLLKALISQARRKTRYTSIRLVGDSRVAERNLV